VVSVLAIGPKDAGSNRAEAMNFKGDKNPQHTLVRIGCKAGVAMS
jgi:hypothetical protein